nr:MAG TPA: hypothetical protein [Caudoviricetes sp.]
MALLHIGLNLCYLSCSYHKLVTVILRLPQHVSTIFRDVGWTIAYTLQCPYRLVSQAVFKLAPCRFNS